MLNISLLALENIKRTAKKIKSEYPDLSHSKRLDIVAKRYYGARNYHEVKLLGKKHLNSQVLRGQTSDKCSYCGLTFLSSEIEEAKEHYSIHLEFEKVEKRLGFLPAQYSRREDDKRKAYKELESHNSRKVKLNGGLRLIRAHFDRSLEEGIHGRYWKKHPTFEEYVEAKADDYQGIIPEEISKEIKHKYGAGLIEINAGKSYWHPSELRNDI